MSQAIVQVARTGSTFFRARRSLHVHYDAPKQLAEQHALKILWFIIGQRLRNIVRGDQLMRAFGL